MTQSKIKGRFTNILIPVLMGLFFYAVLKYQDTIFFQSVMAFLFTPDADLALPPFWQENRMVILGGLVSLVFILYRKTWLTYRQLTQLYSTSPAWGKRPSVLSALQASYLYRQDQTLCLVTWFVDLCRRGLLSLTYTKGINPWTVGRGTAKVQGLPEQDLIETLFQNRESICLQAILSEPDPDVLKVATQLYKETREKNTISFMPHQSSLLAWFVLAALIAEIPLYLASQPTWHPAALVVTVFSAALFAAPAYVFAAELPRFFSASRVTSYLKLGVVVLFVVIIHFFLITDRALGSYWSTAFFPDLLVMLIVLVWKVPLLPENTTLLSQLIGYAKHLEAAGYSIREEDLPWTLGLGIHSDILAGDFSYDEDVLPRWLHTRQQDVQPMMKLMHQSFGQQVSEAVNGKQKSKGNLRSDSSMNRF